MRLDKYLVHTNTCTRSEARNLIRSGRLLVNGAPPKAPDLKINEGLDLVTLDGNEIKYEEYSYYMLNKPAGIVSACEDKREGTVMDFFKNEPCKGLFPVGRLDKDTVGLLLITNDGDLAHRMLAPNKHVWKTYYTELESPLSDGDLEKLKNGVDIGDETPTLPSRPEFAGENRDKVFLSIHEGRFHQVKRMFEAVNNKVVYLKRVTFGPLKLDETLKEGSFRKLTEEELETLK
ncbi:MAG: rRNA pseudouridine synthase [Lachnospiraceae bacterium]|nr:rRNA pseudouridine synthase [Lachnospiraceae bacterium]